MSLEFLANVERSSNISIEGRFHKNAGLIIQELSLVAALDGAKQPAQFWETRYTAESTLGC